jgi:glycosyl transferase family 25
MEIYVISLAGAHERRAAITKQLEKLGLAFEFFDACTGADGYQPFFDGYTAATYRIHSRRDALPGEIGCYASHLSLWQRCAQAGRPMVIIEDDAILTDQLPVALEATEKIITTCGFIRLEPNKQSSRRPRRYMPVGKVDEFEVNYIARVALCGTGYAVSPAAAEQLAKHSKVLLAPVDRYLQRAWSHRQPLYLLSPPVVLRQQGVFTSSIKTGEGAAGKLLTPGLLLRIATIKGAYFFKRVWFNATIGRKSHAQVRKRLARLN